MSESTCRWGILGAAEIARRNWEAIRNTGNGTLAAVASRDVSKAQAFIDDCQSQVPFPSAPKAVGDYDEILNSPEIDAIYIPLPTGLRKDWVIKAARAGKHVLCEKPCAINADDLAEMTAACAEAGVQFMDGVMFMHSDRMGALRKTLDDGKSIGDIRRITSQFSFGAPPEFFEGNILQPKLVGNRVGLHPVWLMFALFAFGSLFGFTGMLIAVPASAAVGVVTRFGLSRYLQSELYHGHGESDNPPQKSDT